MSCVMISHQKCTQLFFNGFSLFIKCEITDIHNLRLSGSKATSDILNTVWKGSPATSLSDLQSLKLNIRYSTKFNE